MTPFKILSFLTVIFFTFSTYAKMPEYVPPFKIISDTIDESLPEGTCLITGVVTYNGKTVNEATIKAYDYNKESGVSDMTVLINSDKLGRIRMNVDTSTYFLTAWKPGTGTAYVEGVKFKSQHRIVLEIYLPEEEGKMIEVEKPVVYLYSTREPKNVTVQVKTEDQMEFTYPQMDDENQWHVKVGQGGIETENGRHYPYLFWEASAKNKEFYSMREGKIVGNIVKTDTVISFLENELLALHLSPAEVTDFITYWGPRLQQNPYAVVQFKVDDEVNEIAELNITPQPDWTRRVFMVFTGFESEPDVEVIDAPVIEDALVKREGFYAIEWGGAELSMIKL